MANQRVTCINKNPRDNAHESIRRLGGVSDLDGSTWNVSLDDLIAWMKKNPSETVYTKSGNAIAIVKIVPASATKREHLRTVADGYYTDNLLALVECVS